MGLSRAGYPAAVMLTGITCIASLKAGTTSQAVGAIKGMVQLSAPMTVETIKVTVDETICGRTQPDPSLVVGDGGVVADVVVMLAGTKGTPTAAPVVVNRHCRFVPHVQVAASKSTLTVKSDDQTLHTTHAYGRNDRSLFNVAIPVPGMEIKQSLGDSTLVRLACDTHPWMRGFVVVTDQIAAVSGADGGFALEGVPAGSYDLQVWHEKLKASPQKVTVTAGQTTNLQIAVGIAGP